MESESTFMHAYGHGDYGRGAVAVLENPERNQMHKLAELIRREFKNHRSVDFYSEALGLTNNTLNKLTQFYYNKSISQLLSEQLLMASIHYLQETKLPLKWITYELGFQDPAYFSRWFKKQSGHSPKDFRKIKHRNSVC